MSRPHKEPGPDHPIEIEARAGRVAVKVGGALVSEAPGCLELREASYPPVAYIPRAAIDMANLEPSDHTSWCPYKGEARYFHGRAADGSLIKNVAWSYEDPFPAVAEIKGALAFYPDRVDAIEM